MDFEKRLERAIQRGERAKDAAGREQAERRLSENELRNLHSSLRIEISEHVEECLRKLADHFPGFRFETIVGSAGWGAKLSRDDVDFSGGQSRSLYSRLELLVSPLGEARIAEIVVKGTIRNKEVFDRAHYQRLEEADVDSFREMVDLWVLEYAEKYAADD